MLSTVIRYARVFHRGMISQTFPATCGVRLGIYIVSPLLYVQVYARLGNMDWVIVRCRIIFQYWRRNGKRGLIHDKSCFGQKYRYIEEARQTFWNVYATFNEKSRKLCLILEYCCATDIVVYIHIGQITKWGNKY